MSDIRSTSRDDRQLTLRCRQQPFNPLQCKANYSATSNNMQLARWPLTGGLLHFVQEETGRSRSPPRPFLAVPNVTVRSLTACSAPITVLRHNGPLLCGFNVLVKGLIGVVTVSSLEPPTTGDRLLK